MKVIFVLYSRHIGGVDRHVLQLMQGLSAQGLSCLYAGPRDCWLGEQIAAAGFQCEHIAFRGLLDLHSHIRLARLIRRERAHVIHAHMNRGAFYAQWASRLTGVPWVATWHDMGKAKRHGSASRIIAVSNAVHRALVSWNYCPERVTTVHSGVPDYAALPLPNPAQIRSGLGLDDAPVISMISRLDKIKGHDVALRALATLKELRWTFLIVGSTGTPWADAMQRLANELGIADRVVFHGHSDDVPSLYACTDILLAPSRRESLSLTLLEASAFSLPIVASNVDGIVEAVADGISAYLVPAENVEALANRIRMLLDDKGLREALGRAGRRHYEANFSLQKMVDGVSRVYTQAVQQV